MADWLVDEKNDIELSDPMRACLAGAGVYSAKQERHSTQKTPASLPRMVNQF